MVDKKEFKNFFGRHIVKLYQCQLNVIMGENNVLCIDIKIYGRDSTVHFYSLNYIHS